MQSLAFFAVRFLRRVPRTSRFDAHLDRCAALLVLYRSWQSIPRIGLLEVIRLNWVLHTRRRFNQFTTSFARKGSPQGVPGSRQVQGKHGWSLGMRVGPHREALRRQTTGQSIGV